jgi:N-acetylneuraminic acid mutarotase
MLYVFGGTDGQYHYNDTWCFDPRTEKWSELQCIGFIPTPREGHSAAVVDDVIYIFGGRGVDGKDLGDLAAFRISSKSIMRFRIIRLVKSSDKRWYMFQNMGPVPNARSGHAMAAVSSRVFVLGGEPYTPAETDDPTSYHVLNTSISRSPFH